MKPDLKKFILYFLISIITIPLQAQNLDLFFKEANTFLEKWVIEGNVNYKKLKENFNEVEILQKQIAEINLLQSSAIQKKAFYINAYNLLVIYQVSKYFPLKSPLDKSGFFDKFNHTVAGTSMTLNRLEKKYLMLTYHDPRIHFAVACASVSCPKLASFAFLPDKLEVQLNSRTSFALDKDNIVSVDDKAKKVFVSKIFDWYKVDLGKTPSASIAFINQYRENKIPKNFSLEFQEYDWTLNLVN